ncbi:mycofactocin oligosaccharide methyltransferase MftM [Mycolicibacterium hodleri]|uniref:Class I SAM-dependent methyltransferase n=1 Tax=Mycolicibacterium hodleri TaxID=49897 RepID=A0A502DVG5_9MYCO|nr:mycofactocin oligosaccharide methyltransferase MftM [Mycolicibacterium hodleri]TPG29508.1 class I SAM-dependent methyltransferase [Mycolicibacterium hodleri]
MTMLSSPPEVLVTRRTGAHLDHTNDTALCTTTFCTSRSDGVLSVQHDLDPDEISDELAVLLATELDDTGVLRGQSEFEAVFTGVVRSAAAGEEGWLAFYRNSLNRLEQGSAAFAPVHQHAASLVVGGDVVDLGSCFGFFPLRMAAAGLTVTATDISGSTMDLLDRVSGPLRRTVRTLTCDAACVPLPDGAADTVTVLHLLEHLDPAAAGSVLREAMRLARRRVIVAVPFEEVPRACYGHVQRFDDRVLRVIADAWRSAGVRAGVHEYHGGWLILDRCCLTPQPRFVHPHPR